MAVTLDWLEEPHIFQMTFQGYITLEEIASGLAAMEGLYLQHEAHPFCCLWVFLPDRQLPGGILQLVRHPSMRAFRHVDAAGVINVDHYIIGMFTEMISQQGYGPVLRQFDTHVEGLQYLQWIVRNHELDVP